MVNFVELRSRHRLDVEVDLPGQLRQIAFRHLVSIRVGDGELGFVGLHFLGDGLAALLQRHAAPVLERHGSAASVDRIDDGNLISVVLVVHQLVVGDREFACGPRPNRQIHLRRAGGRPVGARQVDRPVVVLRRLHPRHRLRHLLGDGQHLSPAHRRLHLLRVPANGLVGLLEGMGHQDCRVYIQLEALGEIRDIPAVGNPSPEEHPELRPERVQVLLSIIAGCELVREILVEKLRRDQLLLRIEHAAAIAHRLLARADGGKQPHRPKRRLGLFHHAGRHGSRYVPLKADRHKRIFDPFLIDFLRQLFARRGRPPPDDARAAFRHLLRDAILENRRELQERLSLAELLDRPAPT